MRDGAAETVSRDQILRRERGQERIHFPSSADHEQYWQFNPVDPCSCHMCDHTYKHVPSILVCRTPYSTPSFQFIQGARIATLVLPIHLLVLLCSSHVNCSGPHTDNLSASLGRRFDTWFDSTGATLPLLRCFIRRGSPPRTPVSLPRERCAVCDNIIA